MKKEKKEKISKATKKAMAPKKGSIRHNKIHIKKEEAKKLVQKIPKIKRKKVKKEKVKVIPKIGEISNKKKMRNLLLVILLFCLVILVRIAFIQFVQGSDLKDKAYMQQTLDRDVNSKRGTIYDATGTTVLATSSTVETVTINPVNIKEEDKEKVARKLSELFELDYDKVLKRVKKKSAIENIAKKIDKEKSNELRLWMKENDITVGINIDQDTKRYYPYNTLASQIIGFCGSDNQGLNGIEAVYEDLLKGEKGKIEKRTDAKR